jgi:pilus assembly protein Flp/PilA
MLKILEFFSDEAGAAASEYALILGVVGLGIVVAGNALSAAIGGQMNRTASIITLAQD